jgi:4-coumarate--CoA ligase
MQIGKDVMLGFLPFYHSFGRFFYLTSCEKNSRKLITGAVTLLSFTLMVGCPFVIMHQFEPEAFCRNVEQYKATMTLVAPPVCLAILHHPGTGCAWM